jgi:adenylate kinase
MRTALILLGPPGAGKGTQARRISVEFAYPAVSTGDILREAVKGRTELGKRAQTYMDSGALVPDELVDAIVKERLARADCDRGFLLDGYPRTIPQAKFLEGLIAQERDSKIIVIGVHVDNAFLMERLANRWTCPKCGKLFNASLNPSKAGDRCDECDTPLVLRKDDTPTVVAERLQVYARETEPLISYFKDRGLYREVDGSQSVDGVYAAISNVVRTERQRSSTSAQPDRT